MRGTLCKGKKVTYVGHVGHAVDAVDAVHSGCSACSTQWMQYAVDSGIWWWGHCLWCRKVKPEDAVDAVCSEIVVYGGGDIVFGAKRSNQWMQWMQYAVHSGIVVYGLWGHCLWCKKVKPVDAFTVDTVHSGCSMQWMQYTVE